MMEATIKDMLEHAADTGYESVFPPPLASMLLALGRAIDHGGAALPASLTAPGPLTVAELQEASRQVASAWLADRAATPVTDQAEVDAAVAAVTVALPPVEPASLAELEAELVTLAPTNKPADETPASEAASESVAGQAADESSAPVA